MALTKITPQMFDTSAAGHDFNIDNGTFVVDASANRVGIGTSSPTQKLDVRGGTGAGAITHAIFTGTSSRGLEIRTRSDTSGGQNSGTAEINSADSEGTGGDLAFSSNGNVRMFIDGGGNVGIGNTGPTNKLSIGQNLGTGFAITAASGTPYGMVLQTDEGTPSANPNFWVRTNDGNAVSTLFRIQNNGLVGIGTTNPLNPLHVKQSGGSHLFALETTYATDRSGRGQISWRDSANITGGIWTEYDGTNVSMRFGNLYSSGYNTNTSMIIRGNGNVGIGTASPAARLSVPNGGFSFDSTTGIPAIRAEGSYGGAIGLLDTKEAGWYALNNGDTLHQYIGRTPGSNAPNANIVMTYLSSGNVGIGNDSPTQRLTIGSTSDSVSRIQFLSSATGASTIHFGDGASADAYVGYINYAHDSNSLQFAANGTERMRINTDGTIQTRSSDGLAPSIGTGCVSIWGRSNSGSVGILRVYKTGDDGNIIDFYRTGNSLVGSISVGVNGTTYNTTSDIKLKENIEPISDGKEKLMLMKASTFNFIADEEKQKMHGFVAQEMKEIIPEAVTGDDILNMDYGRITPILVAALQDAFREIEELRNKLENK